MRLCYAVLLSSMKESTSVLLDSWKWAGLQNCGREEAKESLFFKQKCQQTKTEWKWLERAHFGLSEQDGKDVLKTNVLTKFNQNGQGRSHWSSPTWQLPCLWEDPQLQAQETGSLCKVRMVNSNIFLDFSLWHCVMSVFKVDTTVSVKKCQSNCSEKWKLCAYLNRYLREWKALILTKQKNW